MGDVKDVSLAREYEQAAVLTMSLVVQALDCCL